MEESGFGEVRMRPLRRLRGGGWRFAERGKLDIVGRCEKILGGFVWFLVGLGFQRLL